jgi:hypoxanthine-guanine phosphoribosyltransferase
MRPDRLGGLTVAEIATRLEALVLQIARTIPADFVVIGLLKGATVFVVDLARTLDRAGARPEIADPSRLSGA